MAARTPMTLYFADKLPSGVTVNLTDTDGDGYATGSGEHAQG